MKDRSIKMILDYAIGFIIYTAIIYLTQVIMLYSIGVENIRKIPFTNPLGNIIFYTIFYGVITIVLYIYDNLKIKELNKNLKEMKERIKAHEEEILVYRNNYNNSSISGNI